MTGPGALVAAQASRRPLTFVAVSTAEVSSAGSITYPTGSQEGDLLVLHGAGIPGTLATPSGWTERFNVSAGNGLKTCIYTRIKGSETSVAGPSSNVWTLVMVAYRGGSGVPSIGAVGTSASDNVSPILAPAITPQDAISTVLAFGSDRDTGAGQPGNPTGFTSRSNFIGTNAHRVSEKQFGSTASTGTVSFTQDIAAQPALVVLMEIKP